MAQKVAKVAHRAVNDAPRIDRVLYSMDDACAALSVSMPTVYGLVADGSLDTFMIGKRRFTTLALLQACAEKLQARATPTSADTSNDK